MFLSKLKKLKENFLRITKTPSTRSNNELDLSSINFRGANLDSENLQGARMKKTNLSDCSLVNTNFEESDLSYTNLRYANVKDAIFDGANLNGADLSFVKGWESASFKSCVISEETLATFPLKDKL